ncbi:MAG: response regulator, partial [Verrucomicrobiota bacterium]
MKILLVDDDPAILQALLGILKSNPGYETTIGTNGPLAIENAESMRGVDLLITDVVMDPMDGFTLQRNLLERYPNMKTIFISGYDLSEYAMYTMGSALLSKPFAAQALLEAIAKIEPAVPIAQPSLPRAVAPPIAVATPVAAVPVATPVATPKAVAAAPVAAPVATPVA